MQEKKDDIQLATLLDHGKPASVLAAVRKIFRYDWERAAFAEVETGFQLAKRLYAGGWEGYLACSADYHDWTHVLEVFSASARLLDGTVLSGVAVPAEDAVDLLLAALFHDAGYIQEASDAEGRGGKYTKIHVDRSAAFVLRERGNLGLDEERARRVGRLILGTDLARDWKDIPWADPAERRAAAIVAAGDILGQMGDRAYLEKLLFLYREFREAGIGGYDSAFDILRKTAGFYELTKARLEGLLGEASPMGRPHFKARHGIDRDLYREAIERQMDYLAGILADDSTNFRSKLKRLDLEAFRIA